MHERSYYRALREWDEVMSSIEACYWKAINLYDHVCERALARLQEIKAEVETLKKWWEYTQEHPETPLVDEMTVDITLQEDEMEADAVHETANTILSWIDNTLDQISPDLTDVVNGIDAIMYRVADVYNRLIQASRMTFADELQKIDDAMYKIAAIRHKVDSQTTPDMPFEAVIPGVNASGLDPNDPEWAPPDGWTKVWEFRTSSELDDFANAEKAYADVESDKLVFNPPENETGLVVREVNTPYRKVAVCLKVKILQPPPADFDIVHVEVTDGSEHYLSQLFVMENDTTRLKLHGSTEAVFNNPEDWIVFVFDKANNVLRVYDKNKNVLAEVEPYRQSMSGMYAMIFLREECPIVDVEIDWVAVKEE